MEPVQVLIVDDERDVETLFRLHYAKDEQYCWYFAPNGADALACLRASPGIAIVLADMVMPGMDGLTFCAQAGSEFPQVIVIAVSAHTDIAHIRQAMNAGAFDFLFKPFFFQDVDATLKKAVDVQRRQQHAAQERERLINQNTLLRKAIDTIEIGVTITDQHGLIVYTNPAEARMHGYTVSELIGQSAKRLGSGSRTINVPRPEQDHWPRESVNKKKDGTKFPIYLISTQLREADGQFLGRVTVSSPVWFKKRKQESQRLRRALQIITEQKVRRYGKTDG